MMPSSQAASAWLTLRVQSSFIIPSSGLSASFLTSLGLSFSIRRMGVMGMTSCSDASVVSDSLQPHGLQPARLLCPWDSPGKNTGVGCHALLQGSFLTQGTHVFYIPCIGKIHWKRTWQPNPVFLPGESHGQRSLEGYGPQGHKELDMTKANQHTHT